MTVATTMLSRRAYARHRGCAESAVRKALDRGQIQLEPDGGIDPEKADAAWPIPDSRAAAAAARCEEAPLEPVAGPAVDSVRQILAEAGEDLGQLDPDDLGGLNGAGVTLTDARKAKVIQDSHLVRLRLLQMQGRLVERDKAEAFTYQLARQERDAWLAWPARISGQFAADLMALEPMDQRGVHALLERYVHAHLEELGDLGTRGLS